MVFLSGLAQNYQKVNDFFSSLYERSFDAVFLYSFNWTSFKNAYIFKELIQENWITIWFLRNRKGLKITKSRFSMSLNEMRCSLRNCFFFNGIYSIPKLLCRRLKIYFVAQVLMLVPMRMHTHLIPHRQTHTQKITFLSSVCLFWAVTTRIM